RTMQVNQSHSLAVPLLDGLRLRYGHPTGLGHAGNRGIDILDIDPDMHGTDVTGPRPHDLTAGRAMIFQQLDPVAMALQHGKGQCRAGYADDFLDERRVLQSPGIQTPEPQNVLPKIESFLQGRYGYTRMINGRDRDRRALR